MLFVVASSSHVAEYTGARKPYMREERIWTKILPGQAHDARTLGRSSLYVQAQHHHSEQHESALSTHTAGHASHEG